MCCKMCSKVYPDSVIKDKNISEKQNVNNIYQDKWKIQNVVMEETLAYDMGRIRDVRQGPDGYIYLAISDRQAGPSPIVRLEPVD